MQSLLLTLALSWVKDMYQSMLLQLERAAKEVTNANQRATPFLWQFPYCALYHAMCEVA